MGVCVNTSTTCLVPGEEMVELKVFLISHSGIGFLVKSISATELILHNMRGDENHTQGNVVNMVQSVLLDDDGTFENKVRGRGQSFEYCF